MDKIEKDLERCSEESEENIMHRLNLKFAQEKTKLRPINENELRHGR